jgi:hypothetical protein
MELSNYEDRIALTKEEQENFKTLYVSTMIDGAYSARENGELGSIRYQQLKNALNNAEKFKSVFDKHPNEYGYNFPIEINNSFLKKLEDSLGKDASANAQKSIRRNPDDNTYFLSGKSDMDTMFNFVNTMLHNDHGRGIEVFDDSEVNRVEQDLHIYYQTVISDCYKMMPSFREKVNEVLLERNRESWQHAREGFETELKKIPAMDYYEKHYMENYKSWAYNAFIYNQHLFEKGIKDSAQLSSISDDKVYQVEDELSRKDVFELGRRTSDHLIKLAEEKKNPVFNQIAAGLKIASIEDNMSVATHLLNSACQYYPECKDYITKSTKEIQKENALAKKERMEQVQRHMDEFVPEVHVEQNKKENHVTFEVKFGDFISKKHTMPLEMFGKTSVVSAFVDKNKEKIETEISKNVAKELAKAYPDGHVQEAVLEYTNTPEVRRIHMFNEDDYKEAQQLNFNVNPTFDKKKEDNLLASLNGIDFQKVSQNGIVNGIESAKEQVRADEYGRPDSLFEVIGMDKLGQTVTVRFNFRDDGGELVDGLKATVPYIHHSDGNTEDFKEKGIEMLSVMASEYKNTPKIQENVKDVVRMINCEYEDSINATVEHYPALEYRIEDYSNAYKSYVEQMTLASKHENRVEEERKAVEQKESKFLGLGRFVNSGEIEKIKAEINNENTAVSYHKNKAKDSASEFVGKPCDIETVQQIQNSIASLESSPNTRPDFFQERIEQHHVQKQKREVELGNKATTRERTDNLNM